MLCCLLLLALFQVISGCAHKTTGHRAGTGNSYVVNNKRYYPIPSAAGYSESGIASWYGPGFHGKRTSNGEVYDMHAMTAAHKTLPMNTMLLVKNLQNGRQTVVRINDRGPFVRGRIVDLSFQAAKAIGLVKNGTAKVEVVALGEDVGKKTTDQPTLAYRDLSIGEFYVQIGAFTKQINAVKLQKRFTDAGHIAIIQQGIESGAPFYRVQVYTGKTLQKAQRAEKDLLESGYTGAFVIAR